LKKKMGPDFTPKQYCRIHQLRATYYMGLTMPIKFTG